MTKKSTRKELSLRPQQVALQIKELCIDTKGEDIVILDIRKVSDIADFFIIVSGNSTRHVYALADNIQDGLRKEGVRPYRVDGEREARWIVLDYYDVMVHVFCKDVREYYNLERLWGDAPQIS